MKSKIWEMIKDLVDTRYHEQLCLFEGVEKYELAVQDIVCDIQDLAVDIEEKLKEGYGRIKN